MAEAYARPYPQSFPLRAATFTTAIFVSASLVFLVQPMVAKLLLPKLGGTPAVWNASMVFFQVMLLAGYGYAHLLQRVRDLRIQAAVHLALLAAAALTLPIALRPALGDPAPEAPVRWLLPVLLAIVGAPFAVLSATAPLLQAWFTRLDRAEEAPSNPYALYVASNVGSILALVAYPTLVEPFLPLGVQGRLWALGYAVFAVLVGAIGVLVLRTPRAWTGAATRRVERAPAIGWRTRASWILLSAAPASLLLGVTTFISTDVAAAPFLWVLPLALYLLTFIVAFQERPAISRRTALVAQVVLTPLCLASLPVVGLDWGLVLALHGAAFFFTALVCHQALAARRPPPAQLTDFYLSVSLGGVVGGALTAFAAPVLFSVVAEYPIVMVAAALARPAFGRASRETVILVGVAMAAAAALVTASVTDSVSNLGALTTFAVGLAAAVLLRRTPVGFAAALAALAVQAGVAGGVRGDLATVRSFFGVNRVKLDTEPALGGQVHTLSHGTTLHGAQALSPRFRCQPTTYYAPGAAMGQVYRTLAARRPQMKVGVVGLGTGAMATYVRAGDRMRFFEIDPAVERLASDPRYFTYLSACSRGKVDVVLGDARLTLTREPASAYDLLQLDAFTSDAIPTHLLTAQALREYLGLVKPDGVVVLHISNRHLALEAPLAATADEAGAQALIQNYRPPKGTPRLVASPSDVMLLARTPAALAPFLSDPRWRRPRAGARAWTDDYTNVLGALVARLRSHPQT